MNTEPPVSAEFTDQATPATTRRTSGRRVVARVAALSSLPFVLATLLWHLGWQPGRAINHGELLATADRPLRQLQESDLAKWIAPPAPLPPQKISGNATLPVAGPATKPVFGHWLLAVAVPAECTQPCLDQLHLARQVQVSLNKNMARLQRALIGPQLADNATLAAVQSRWPDLLIAQANATGWQTLGGDALDQPQLLLIDPQGVLVLRYAPTPDPKGLRRDVERLLKYSWLG